MANTKVKSKEGDAAPDNITDIVREAGDAILKIVEKQEKYITSLEPDTLSDIQALKLQLLANTCATTMMKLEHDISTLHREVKE